MLAALPSVSSATQELRDLVAHTESSDLILIIGCNADAHHIRLGSSKWNPTGAKLFDLITSLSSRKNIIFICNEWINNAIKFMEVSATKIACSNTALHPTLKPKRFQRGARYMTHSAWLPQIKTDASALLSSRVFFGKKGFSRTMKTILSVLPI